jgi:hypothetical protein
MNRILAHASWALALSLGLLGLSGCSGSSGGGTPTPVASITSFVASPTAITAGASVNLTAVFANGTGVITPGNVAVSSGTVVTVSPTATTTYTLTVTPPTGTAVTQTATVTVTPAPPSITSFSATPATITAGASATLTGVFANGTGIITPGNLPVTSGAAVTVSPTATTTYTLTVTPATGTAVTQTATVTVTPATASITSFVASPATIAAEASATLTAVFANGTGVITPGNLAVTSGTPVTVTPTTTTTYTLTVTPASGSAITQPVTVTVLTSVTVNQSSIGPPVTDQLMGMNMAIWYDPTTSAILPAFKTAGIKAMRWPGGSESDDYHWASNTLCQGLPLAPAAEMANAQFSTVASELIIPGGLDLALTADYGTNATCTGPGDPAEAAAWVTAALADGVSASHVTVGNEEYGSWEEDLHSIPNDPTTYANAVVGPGGYYDLIKAANSKALVGVSVNPGNEPAWDPIVLSKAKYDFVEYHFYPQAPGQESDTFLVRQAAQELTSAIKTIQSELAAAGQPDTPIYVGEIGSVYTDPGKQTSSITQALFAGQVLGEMMNAGVSRATWWLGFGGCSDSTGGNFSSSLYGWQTFGGYMVFSDGTPEYGCESAPVVPPGTLLPTARAFQLFSSVALNGENVLSASVAGDATDVRAYAATNNGGAALVIFNLNETTSIPVVVALSGQSAAYSVTVQTYSKAIYDQSQSNFWAPPTTSSLGAQTLPLTLTLAPWSMNVVVVK